MLFNNYLVRLQLLGAPRGAPCNRPGLPKIYSSYCEGYSVGKEENL